MTRGAGRRFPRSRDSFEVLGLGAEEDLTDDDVRIAWRRIASATHPDRADGGDPVQFALAAAAYTELRTRFGRNEARATRAAGAIRTSARARIAARIRYGRPVRLLLRLAIAVAAALAGVAAAGPDTAAAPALVVGALTWFLLTARADLGRSAGVRAGRDRLGRVGRPLRPRTDVEGGRQSG